jgi:hypothetical protein
MLAHVTFTGWDDRTDYADLDAFCRDQQPGTVEIAVLLSHGRMGDDRYPSIENAEAILRFAKARRQRAAVHLCGPLARQAMALDQVGPLRLRAIRRAAQGLEPASDRPMSGGADSPIFKLADRIQVNVSEGFWPDDGDDGYRYAPAAFLSGRAGRPVIVQTRDPDGWPDGRVGRVQFLFDRSGGRGEVAEQIPPLTTFPIGYAGGLGPGNVHAFLDRLRPMSHVRTFAPIWIDMESGIRESMAAFSGGPSEPLVGSDKVTPAPTYVSVAKCQQVMDAVRWALLP